MILAILNLLTIGVYLLFQSTPFHYSHDYVAQYQIFLIRIGQNLETFFTTGVFPLWDKSLFYGADTIGSLAYYGMGDIWTYFILLFGEKHISEGILLAYVLKLTLGSYFVYLLLKRNKISESTSFYLSLLYNCSFWSIAVISYVNHTNYLLYVPLMLYLAEDLIINKPKTRIYMIILLTISLMNSLIYSFTFSVIVFTYIAIKRFILSETKVEIKKILSWTLEWTLINIASLIAGSIIIVPQIAFLLGSTRSPIQTLDNPFLYALETTLNIISPNYSVLDGFRLSYSLEISSFASYLIVPLILFGVFNFKYFKQIKEFKVALIAIAIQLIALYIQPLNNFLNLFTGTYQRWVLITVIFQLILAGFVIDYLKENPRQVKDVILSTLVLTLIGLALNLYFYPSSGSTLSTMDDQIVSFLFVLSLLCIFILFKNHSNLLKYAMVINIIFAYFTLSIYHFHASRPYPFASDFEDSGAFSSIANRGILYNGAAPIYYNSFIANAMADRTTLLTYSETVKELRARGIDMHLAMARDYNIHLQYLIGSRHRETISFVDASECYDAKYCLTPTGNGQSRALVLDMKQTLSLEDFKTLNIMEKNRALVEYLIADKTNVDIHRIPATDTSEYWTKDDKWYTHTYEEGDTKPILYSKTSTFFCVNLSNGDCELSVEGSYFDTDIVGLKSISVNPRNLSIRYAIGEVEVPFVEIYEPQSVVIPEKTAIYNWVDSNKLEVNLRDVAAGELVVFPIAYSENFKVKNAVNVELIDTQLGMLSFVHTGRADSLTIQYEPPYLRWLRIIYAFGVIATVFTVLIKRRT